MVPNATLDDLDADLLDKVELTMALKKAFDIEIGDAGVEKIRTVQDVIEYINSHVKVGSE